MAIIQAEVFTCDLLITHFQIILRKTSVLFSVRNFCVYLILFLQSIIVEGKYLKWNGKLKL